jgi:hypothetical protein
MKLERDSGVVDIVEYINKILRKVNENTCGMKEIFMHLTK